jgi:hypothetical protein
LVASFLGTATLHADGLHGWSWAAFSYERLRARSSRRVRLMSALSVVLATLVVLQTLAWIAELLG